MVRRCLLLLVGLALGVAPATAQQTNDCLLTVIIEDGDVYDGRGADPVVLAEALALALPDYPRGDEEVIGEQVFTEPGKEAMTDEDAKPFAGLAALRDKLTGEGGDD